MSGLTITKIHQIQFNVTIQVINSALIDQRIKGNKVIFNVSKAIVSFIAVVMNSRD